MPGTDTNIKRLIVIGASAGGIEALLRLVPKLQANIPASICVVVHTSARAKSLLPQLLSRAGKLKAKYAEEGETLVSSQIYVAPPDFHLVLDKDKLRLKHGPRENLHRPAIDPLFRSAAAEFDGSVIGVVLSGMLDDGTNGLVTIKKAGGIAIVQNPEDSSFSGMPNNAIEHVDVDFVLNSEDIADKLTKLCEDSESRPIARYKMSPGFDYPNVFSCPECGGALKEDENREALHFSCHVGHKISGETLLSGQITSVERALWSAVRALREQAALSDKIAARLRKAKPDSSRADRYEKQAQLSVKEAEQIILLVSQISAVDDTGEYSNY